MALLAALPVVWTTAAPAAAHLSLVSSNPKDGVKIARPPRVVVLTFNERPLALGTTIRVIGPRGEVQRGRPQLVDNSVRQALQPDAPAGDYRILWRVSSPDSHPVTGRLSFTVQAAASRAPSPARSTESSPEPVTPSSQVVGASGPLEQPASPSGGSAIPWIAVGLIALASIGYSLIRQLRRSAGGSE
jgi:methionine-rich copper-binding protein CopC